MQDVLVGQHQDFAARHYRPQCRCRCLACWVRTTGNIGPAHDAKCAFMPVQVRSEDTVESPGARLVHKSYHKRI
jgi:hypothetical protein